MVKKKIYKNDMVFLVKDYISFIVSSSNKKKISVYIHQRLKNGGLFTTNKCLPTASYGKRVRMEHNVSFLISNYMHFTDSKEEKYVTARNYIDGLIKREFRLGRSSVDRSFPAVVAYPNIKISAVATMMILVTIDRVS